MISQKFYVILSVDLNAVLSWYTFDCYKGKLILKNAILNVLIYITGDFQILCLKEENFEMQFRVAIKDVRLSSIENMNEVKIQFEEKGLIMNSKKDFDVALDLKNVFIKKVERKKELFQERRNTTV